MWMLNILKILFREKLRRTQTQSEQNNGPNRSPSYHISDLSPTACWAVFVLFACVSVDPCNGYDSCATPYVSQESLDKLTWAINDLTFNLYRSMSANSSDNFFFSPLSISSAFEMVFYGTRGRTAEELRNVLGYNRAALPSVLVHSAFRDLLCDFQSDKNSSLTFANAIVTDEDLHVWPYYKDDVRRLYQAYVRDVNFGRDTHAVVQEINNWVKDKTNGRIGKLVDKLDSLTVMVLLNAVYFKGKWKKQFDMSDTKLRLFYNYGLEMQGKQVPMMRATHRFRTLLTRELHALELPYEGNGTSMLVLVPQRRLGLAEFERTLTVEKLAEILGAMRLRRTRVALPKFKFEYTRELSQDFKDLGVNRIFQEGYADFSGMTPSRFVHVSGVLHKVTVEVNEEGSEAAAATGIVMSSRSMPNSFVADHPFVFAILDKDSGVLLLVGRVTNL